MQGNVDGIRNALVQHDMNVKQGSASYDPDQIMQWNKTMERGRCTQIDGNLRFNAVLDFFPKTYSLEDNRRMTEAAQMEAAKKAKQPGMQRLERHALSYIAQLERRWFSATHQASTVDEPQKRQAIAERDSFRAVLREFLGSTTEVDLDQQPTLFGRPIAEAQLSLGQSLLLQMAVALHAQGSQLDGLILLLDEPECHLHPAVVIEAIRRLRSLNSLGQIWIATHCVPVLASMPTDSIWYINDGGASWAGRRPETVLEGLLGGPGGREQMEEFLRLPAQFASNRFAAECLVAPKAVDTGADDPQARQVREFCEIKALASTTPLRLLDFGAGQGRLLAAMSERWQDGTDFALAVDYRAFEPYPDDSNRLDARIASIYREDRKRRVFRSTDQLSTLDPMSIDVLVLCNVLHEIPPEEWRRLFGAEGVLTRLLKGDGHVLVLEDMEIPHGEKAHRFGFLLLDNPHLHQLMRSTESDAKAIETVHARDSRLRVHMIPACQLGRTDRQSTIDTLKLLQETARSKVVELRHADLDARNGRLHALWTQLLANADLGLLAL